MRKWVVAVMGAASMMVASGLTAQTPGKATVPLSLRDAVARAAAATAGVKVAGLRVSAAESRVGEARSPLLPRVSFSGFALSHTFNLDAFGFELPTEPGAPPMDPLIGPVGNSDARIRVDQTIFDPANYLRMRAARVGVDASEAEREGAREAAGERAALAYLKAQRAAVTLDARREDERLAAELLVLAQAQLDAGTGTAIDVTRARTQQVAAEGAVQVAENLAEQARIELALTLGADPATRYVLDDSLTGEPLVAALPESLDSLVTIALRDRPELDAASAARARARSEKRAIQAEWLPTVGLFADYGASGIHFSDAIATHQFGVQVSIPILNGLGRSARVAEQNAGIKEAEIREADLQRQVKADVQTALLQLRSGEQQRETARVRVTLAEQELAQARERFANGIADNIELINAQASLNHARDAEIEAQYEIAAGQVNLATAVGVLAGER